MGLSTMRGKWHLHVEVTSPWTATAQVDETLMPLHTEPLPNRERFAASYADDIRLWQGRAS